MDTCRWTSPYSSQLVRLELDGGECFYIPRTLLQLEDKAITQCKNMSWKDSEQNSFYSNGGYYSSRETRSGDETVKGLKTLKWSVSEEVAHVIIHFLYTGEYQISDIVDTKIGQDKTSYAFRLSMQVFYNITDWELPRLRAKVQSKIESLSKSIHISKIVKIIDDEIGDLTTLTILGMRDWLYQYLEIRLKIAVQNGEIEFQNMSLLDKLENANLFKFIAKKLFKILNSHILVTNEADKKMHPAVIQETCSTPSSTIFTPTTSSSDTSEIEQICKQWLAGKSL